MVGLDCSLFTTRMFKGEMTRVEELTDFKSSKNFENTFRIQLGCLPCHLIQRRNNPVR